MFASTFYFLKRKTENAAHFVYGYGLDVGESDFKELRSSFVQGTPKGWKLIRISGIISKEELIKHVSYWNKNPVNTFNTESLSFPEWTKRPTVYSKAHIYKNKDHFRQCARIALWQAWKKYDPTIGDFAPYAYRTMLTTLYNELHRQNRDSERYIAVEKEALINIAQQNQQQYAEYFDFPLLETIFEILTEAEKQLLISLYVHQLSYEELSKQTNTSIAALRKRRNRLLKRLRDMLKR